MKISLKLLLGFGFTLFIILILTSTFIYQKKKIENNTTWVFHTSEVLQNSEEIQKMVSDMETGMRGYLLTGKKDFLDPYTRANQRMEERVSNLNGMIKDNPVQKKRLDEFKRVLALWNNTFAMPLIAAKSDSGIEGRKKYDYMFHEHVMKSRGKIYTDKLRAVMNDFVNEEVSLQKKRTANLQESLNNANYLVIMLAVIALLATSGIGYLITRSIKRRISEMVDYSVGIASGNFTDRIKDTSHDEMKMLSESLNQMSERLEVAFDNLKRTNQELDQFAYIVSHDLKAPLRAFSSVINWLEEDLGGRIDNDIQQHFTTLKSRISRMEGLINGLLEYSRIGSPRRPKSAPADSPR